MIDGVRLFPFAVEQPDEAEPAPAFLCDLRLRCVIVLGDLRKRSRDICAQLSAQAIPLSGDGFGQAGRRIEEADVYVDDY